LRRHSSSDVTKHSISAIRTLWDQGSIHSFKLGYNWVLKVFWLAVALSLSEMLGETIYRLTMWILYEICKIHMINMIQTWNFVEIEDYIRTWTSQRASNRKDLWFIIFYGTRKALARLPMTDLFLPWFVMGGVAGWTCKRWSSDLAIVNLPILHTKRTWTTLHVIYLGESYQLIRYSSLFMGGRAVGTLPGDLGDLWVILDTIFQKCASKQLQVTLVDLRLKPIQVLSVIGQRTKEHYWISFSCPWVSDS